MRLKKGAGNDFLASKTAAISGFGHHGWLAVIFFQQKPNGSGGRAPLGASAWSRIALGVPPKA